MSALASIRGDAPEASLFARAAELVRSRGIQSDGELGALLDSPPPNTKPDLLRRLQFIHTAGAWVLVESSIADLPADLRWLLASDAVTIDELAALHAALGVTSLSDLRDVVRTQTIRRVPGLSPRVESAVADALPALRASIPRVPLGRAMSLADPVLTALRGQPGVSWAECAGSLRRGQDSVGDIEIIVATSTPSGALDTAQAQYTGARCLHRGPQRSSLLIERVQVAIRCVEPDVGGAWLLHLTGSPAHVDQLRALAAAHGRTLHADGLSTPNGAPISVSEENIYAALGLPWIPPEIRHGDTEVVTARQGALPILVSRDDIRGDLHVHSDYSDGRDSVATMVAAAALLGYEYVAITDHSPHSASSRNLTRDSVARQADDIEGLRQQHPTMTILHGCEVDIVAGGRLDFSDRILERFDIVLASLHEDLGHSPPQLLDRYLAAMKHPLVNVITHPTNRLVPGRRGYALDYDRLFDAAVETGTALEIDGAPSHLDMDGAMARRAIAAGAVVTIDSDGHRAEVLDRQMRLGLLTARRGWAEPRHVLNAQSVDGVRRFVAAKRSR